MIKFVDLDSQYHKIEKNLAARWHNVMTHKQFVGGPEITELEKKLAQRIHVDHCITVANGTVALQLALMALDVGPGDEVILPAFSFFATAEVVLLLGAIPVFVDIDQKTYNVDPAKLKKAITPKTKAIMAVSLYGQPADFDAINAVALEHGLPVIEDGAQSYGATYKDNYSCALTQIACTSFFPSKPLGCYADGGACFTNDAELAEKIRCIAHHGEAKRYHHQLIGMNARFGTLQAAVLLAKLDIFDEEIALRQQVACWYNQNLPDFLNKPYVESYNKSIYAQYTVRVPFREKIQHALAEKNIPTAVHYPKVMYQQPCIKDRYQDCHCPVAEQAAAEVLSLPFSPYLEEEVVKRISSALAEVVDLVGEGV